LRRFRDFLTKSFATFCKLLTSAHACFSPPEEGGLITALINVSYDFEPLPDGCMNESFSARLTDPSREGAHHLPRKLFVFAVLL
jgi:hypothetical protein